MLRAEQLTINGNRKQLLDLKDLLIKNEINFYTQLRSSKHFTGALMLMFEFGNRYEQNQKIKFYKLLDEHKDIALGLDIKLDILTREL